MEPKDLAPALKDVERAMRYAVRDTLNDMGFTLRDMAWLQINLGMQVRRQGMRKFLRVDRTKAVLIRQQVVMVGSQRKGQFSGWRENEFGGYSDRDRTIMLFARGGDKSKIVPKGNRINAPIATAESRGIGGSEGNRTYGLLAQLGREGYKGLFQLDGTRFQGGVFKIVPGAPITRKGRKTPDVPRFKKVQQDHQRLFLKKQPWMDAARLRLIKGPQVRETWERHLKEQMAIVFRNVRK